MPFLSIYILFSFSELPSVGLCLNQSVCCFVYAVQFIQLFVETLNARVNGPQFYGCHAVFIIR